MTDLETQLLNHIRKNPMARFAAMCAFGEGHLIDKALQRLRRRKYIRFVKDTGRMPGWVAIPDTEGADQRIAGLLDLATTNPADALLKAYELGSKTGYELRSTEVWDELRRQARLRPESEPGQPFDPIAVFAWNMAALFAPHLVSGSIERSEPAQEPEQPPGPEAS